MLEDPNKKIHKIFKRKEDDDLQILLFGETKDLSYINLNKRNEINYPINDKLKEYVNYILNAKGVKSKRGKMQVHFYIKTYEKTIIQEQRVEIIFQKKEGKDIASIEQVYYVGGLMGVGGGYNTLLNYRHNDKWNKQKIQKKDIIQQYNIIKQNYY